jgi:anti-anti-sigma regulatory factor
MALFSKPPSKKPEPLKLEPKSGMPMTARTPPPHSADRPVSAREVAHDARGKKGVAEWPGIEPAGEISVGGASLMEWSPSNSSIEVLQTNPGLCSVLENASLLFAGGQLEASRTLLEQGVRTDHDAMTSPLAWLALFDVLQRANDRAAFERTALQYVVQFERSAPAWEEGLTTTAGPKVIAGGYIPVTGKLTAASASQIEGMRRSIERKVPHARLDLASVTGFDDAGARLLAEALAYARKHRFTLSLQRPEKLEVAVTAMVKRGRDGGEGAWLLSLELLQFANNHDAFDERSIEYAIAFEQSPPSWDPPPAVGARGTDGAGTTTAEPAPSAAASADMLTWSGVLSGQASNQLVGLSEYAIKHAVVPIDMTAVERIDFVCAGALFNAINRIEQQRKSVQIIGATPIIRALLLLIGISPRHFVKKPQ